MIGISGWQKAPDPLAQDRHVEVDQERLRGVREPEIGEDLRDVNRQDALNALHLDQKRLFDHEVDAELTVDQLALVGHRHWHFGDEGDRKAGSRQKVQSLTMK
jgi:hypothetical protein